MDTPPRAECNLPIVESLASAIAVAHTAARVRWPDLAVAAERFADEIVRRLGADFDPAALASIVTDDVYLAIACLDGDPRAIAHLDADYLSEVARAARKVRASDAQAADVRGHLHRVLFTSEPGRVSGLAGFAGRGDLRGYIRVIATRELVRLVERGKREEPIDTLLDELDVSRAPELSLLYARHGSEIGAALRSAIDALDERSRAVLRYSMVSGWSVDRIGELYDVHRSTAGRWLAQARDELGALIRREVASRLAIPVEEVDSIVREVQSKVDVSLLRIL